MAKWITPKTDWSNADKFNIDDYNRIKNNLFFIWKYGQEIVGEFDIEDMGDDITSYAHIWDVEMFNIIERNFEKINQNTIKSDVGIRQTFYPNGVFIRADELNRIERGSENIKRYVDGWLNARVKLPFALGGVKGLYI